METIAQQIKKEGIKEGINIGIKEGINKGIKETARRMLLDNVSIENVRKYTGLTEKEIKKLLN